MQKKVEEKMRNWKEITKLNSREVPKRFLFACLFCISSLSAEREQEAPALNRKVDYLEESQEIAW